ncbi:hypothetical protein ACWENR_27875 [Micromonospora sp. NPDC004336]
MTEQYVEREFPRVVGHRSVAEVVTVAVDDGRPADVEVAIFDMARQMAERGADVAALAVRLAERRARRYRRRLSRRRVSWSRTLLTGRSPSLSATKANAVCLLGREIGRPSRLPSCLVKACA